MPSSASALQRSRKHSADFIGEHGRIVERIKMPRYVRIHKIYFIHAQRKLA